MRNFKKFLSVFLAVSILLSTFGIALSVNAQQTANNEPLKIEITTDKSSYSAYGIAKITVTVTNTSDEAIENIIAEAVFEQLAPVDKSSVTYKEVDSLESGESFDFTYKATINSSEVKINFFEKILLWFVRLFNGGYTAESHNIEADIENVTEISFGKYVVESITTIEYNNKDSETNNFKFTDFYADIYDIYIGINQKVVFTAKIESATQTCNNVSVFDSNNNFICSLNSTDNNGTFFGTTYLSKNEPQNIEYYAICDNTKSEVFKICFYKDITETEFNSFDDIRKQINELSDKNDVINILENPKTEKYIKSWYDNGDSIVFTSIYGFKCVWIDNSYFEEGYKRVSLNNKQNITNNTPSGNTYQDIIDEISNLGFTSPLSDKDVIVIRPYRSTDFQYDDFLTTGEILADTIGGTVETFDNDNATVSILKTLNDYGVILIDSHGYLDKKTKETYICLTQEYSDIRAICSADFWAERIIVMTDGRVYVHSDFFETHYEENDFKDSFVFLGTCYSMYNTSFADALISKGASYVYGFTNKVSVGYCNNTLIESVLENLILDCESSSVAYNDTVSVCGKSDPTNQTTKFVMQGSNSLYICKSMPIIKGTIKDSTTKDTISKLVTIKILDNNNTIVAHTKADVNGNFSVKLQKGKYTIVVECDEYTTYTDSITIDESTVKDLGTIVLTKKGGSSDNENTASVHGTVVDKDSGINISDVKVSLYSEATKKTLATVTDASGAFKFENLAAGNYTISFEHEDYKTDSPQSIKLTDGLMYVFIDPIELTKKDSSGEDSGEDNNELIPDPDRTVTASGNCGANGDNVKWILYEDGELVIGGNGAMDSSNPWLVNFTKIKKATIKHGITNISTKAFKECWNLTEVSMPSSIANIETQAFLNCSNLHNVIIPNGVRTIGKSAFKGSSLRNISLPNTLTTIGVLAFFDCWQMTEINIPKSVTTIGSYAFAQCDSLKSVNIPSSVSIIGQAPFIGEELINIIVDIDNQYFCSDEYGVLYNKDKTKLIQFPVGSSLTEYRIPNGVISIEPSAFSFSAQDYAIPFSFSTPNKSTNLKNIYIPNSVKEIGAYAFANCGKLKSITIPNNITKIEGNAFQYCYSIESITIPNTVKYVGWFAFEKCENITDVYYIGTKDEWNNIDIGNYNTYLTNATIHYNS